jgi:hypothetical protein
VLILASEDNLADTIRPRLDAAGADTSRVIALQGRRITGKTGGDDVQCITLADIDVIEAALRQMLDCKLIIVDPVGSYLGARADTNRDNEVRAILAPLAALAARREVAVVVVCHSRKSGSQSHADDMILGSVGFTGIARSVLHVMADRQDADQRRKFLLPGKSNLAAPSLGRSFSIECEPPRILWGETVAESADEVAGASSRPGPKGEQTHEAIEWLRTALANGPRPSKELFDEAAKAGISRRTLQRAQKEAGIQAYREKVPGPWFWRLPDSA